MARTLRLVLALVLAVIGGLAVAPPAHAAGTNTVVFTATDPDGNPLAISANLGVFGAGSYGGRNSDTGQLTWSGIDDGDYAFFISAASMDGYRLYYDGTANGSTTPSATPVHLSGGQTITFTVQFPRLATLAGTVATSTGDPLADVWVLINRGGTVKSVRTDAAGHYNFGYLRSGQVTISTGAAPGWVAAPPAVITIPASGAVDHPLTLTEAGSIDGTLVFDRDGSPASAITVVAFTKATTSYVNTTTTDASGHFHFDGLAATAFILRYTDPLAGPVRSTWWSGNTWTSATATAMSVTAGATTTYNERLIYPDPSDNAHTLAGTVTNPGGTPLAGIAITATDGANQADTITDRNGRWALSTPDGSWTIRAASGSTLQSLESATPWYPQYYAGAGVADTAGHATVVPVSGDTTDGLDLALSRSARVKADVRAAGSSATVSPTWLPYTTGGTALPSAPTDDQGNPLLRPGSYKLLVAGEAAGTPLLPRWYGGGASLATAPTLTLAAGDDLTGSAVSLASNLAATSTPTVSGSAAVGGRLTATRGAWNLETGTTYTTRWTRGSTVVSSASSYQPTTADAGATLSYSVTATNSAFGHTFTRTTTVPVAVAKVASTTSVKAKALGAKKVRFTITVTGVVPPTGTVTIRRGSKVVGTAKLSKGKATITVKRQPKGKKSYQATFNGSTQVASSTSKTVKVKVR